MTNSVPSPRRAVTAATVALAAALGWTAPTAAADPVLPVPPGPGYVPAVQPAAVPVPGLVPAPALAPAPALVPAPALAPAPATVPGRGPALAVGPAAVPGTVSATVPGSTPATVPGAPAVPAAGPVAPPAPVPATSGTLREYFAAHQVTLERQLPAGFTALNITLPVPRGWTQVPDPNVPDAFAVFANRRSGALYTPNAQLVVYRLAGHFDPREAITHGYVDNQKLPAWQTTNASMADFDGFPSSLIEGTYREGDMTLNTSQRHVIVPTGADAYLVTLTVTTGVGQSVGSAPATDGIVNGFRVQLPGATPAAAAPAMHGAAGAPLTPGPVPVRPGPAR